MTMERDDVDRQENLTKSYIAADKIYQMRLYYVRIHDVQDSLKLQADFGDHTIFDFIQGDQIDNNNVSGPFIYTLDLILKKETSGKLTTQFGDCWKPIDRFNMQGARGLGKLRSIIYNERQTEGHALNDYLGKSCHYFLLDVQFSSKLMVQFPGKMFINHFTSIIQLFFLRCK